MKRAWWLPLAGSCAVALLIWNYSNFVGAEAKARMKDLTFLPSPQAAKLMTLGHRNTVAKLRWIDSFAYFQLQLERKDDTVASSGESAFKRLYDTLIALDPHFIPFYEHALLNLAGILKHHQAVLGLLQRGLLDNPHSTVLWRLTLVEFHTMYDSENRNPVLMESLLQAWHAAELTEAGKQQPWDWAAAMARRQGGEIRQLVYWEEQLRLSVRGSPTYDFIIGTMREQVARYGESEFNKLLAGHRTRHGFAPLLINELTAPSVVAAVYPQRVPSQGPLVATAVGYRIRPDPYGYLYELRGDEVISPGLQLYRLQRRTGIMTANLEALAKQLGYWPDTLDKALAAGLQLDPTPTSARWELTDKSIRLISQPPLTAAWDPSE